MNDHEKYTLALSAYLDGELGESERAKLLAHLETCEVCKTYLAELTELRDAFGGLEDVEVPAGFAGGILTRLQADAAVLRGADAASDSGNARTVWEKRRSRRGWIPLAACAAVVVLMASALSGRFCVLPVGCSNLQSMGGAGAPSSSSASSICGDGADEYATSAADTAWEDMAVAEEPTYAAAADGSAPGEARDEILYRAESAPDMENGLDAPAASPGAQNGAGGGTTSSATGGTSGGAADSEGNDTGGGETGGAAEKQPARQSRILRLYGEGAKEWLEENSFSVDSDGVYAVSEGALGELPEGLTLGDDGAVELWHMRNAAFALVRVGETEDAP